MTTRGRDIFRGRAHFHRITRWIHDTRHGGDAVLETVIIVPAILLLLGTMIVAGNVVFARQKVQHAAEEAARAASIARPAVSAAAPAARAAADRDMTARGLNCTSKNISTDVASLSMTPGVPAFVRVTVTCEIALSILGIPGIAGHRTITETAVSPADTYRERVR